MKKKAAFSIVFSLLFICAKAQMIFNGYTDKSSYRANETVHFFLSGVMPPFNAGFLTLFTVDEQVVLLIPLNNAIISNQNINPNLPFQNGFDYQETIQWQVPGNLPSGRYLLEKVVPFIIKGDILPATIDGTPAAEITVVVSTNTDEAYNNAGGFSFYDPNSSNNYYPRLSFHRPLNDTHHFMDGFLAWQLTQTQNNFNFIADKDLDDWSEIEHSKLIILIGHSEYWTRAARKNFDKFVNLGGNAMVLSGNTMCWQVRYEDDPNNSNNPQLVFHGNAQNNVPPMPDPINCELKKTYLWPSTNLKYSNLSSIGSTWGSYGKTLINVVNNPNDDLVYGGFQGFKAVSNSPLLSNSNISMGNIIPVVSDEMDWTPMEGLQSATGDPYLDVSPFGFYRAEVLAYDKPCYSPYTYTQGQAVYSPILLFQKTCSSGKVLNVNSTDWCSMNSFFPPSGDTKVKDLTANFISLLLNPNASLFTEPEPEFILLKPATSSIEGPHQKTTVAYEACSDGYILFTPCGVEMEKGYRVDYNDGSGSLQGGLLTCDPTCLNGQRIANISNQNQSVEESIPTPNLLIASLKIFPNPADNKVMIDFPSAEFWQIEVYSSLGQLQISTKTNQSRSTTLNTESLESGFYSVKISNEKETYTQRIIIAR
jgi:hypothetical protein